MPRPMTISKELFYSDEMVTKRYEKLSNKDKARFNQMKDLVEAIKRDTGDYGLIEDLMAQVVAKHFGQVKKEDVASGMGKEEEGVEGGKALGQVGGRLQINKEPGAEPYKVVVTAIVPAEEASLIPYHIVEDEDGSDCIALGSEDSDIEEINKIKVRDILKNLADLKRQEAECLDKLSEAVPNMRDSDITVMAEKVHGGELPKYFQDMYQRIGKPRNFRVAPAAGKRLLTLYLKNQVGSDIATIPDLCTYFGMEKTKLHEVLRCQKYKTKLTKKDKKPPRCITSVPVKEEGKTKEPPAKKARTKKSSRKKPKKSSKKKPKKSSKKKTPVTATKPSTT